MTLRQMREESCIAGLCWPQMETRDLSARGALRICPMKFCWDDLKRTVMPIGFSSTNLYYERKVYYLIYLRFLYGPLAYIFLVQEALESVKTNVIPIPGSSMVETIVIRSERSRTANGLPSCVTSPHGGPHAASTTAFVPSTTALVLEGC